MKDDAKGEVQLYQYFSQCLKLFMRKMLLITKIVNSDTEQLTSRLEQNMSQVLLEGNQLLDKFDQLCDDTSKIQPYTCQQFSIFSRFVLRVRQSVHNYYLKTSASEIVNFLKFLESIIKQFSFSPNRKVFLKIILLKTPKKICNFKQNLHQGQIQLSSVSYVKVETNNPKMKENSLFNCYDKYLQALNRQYRLFDCLNIQQSHYRRTFFLALEDQNRKGNNLFQQMMCRNRYAKQSLQIYQKQFINSRKRYLEKQSRLLRTQAQLSLQEVIKKKPVDNILTMNKQKSASNQRQELVGAQRLKTDYNMKSLQRQSALIFSPLHNFKNKRAGHNSKQSIMTPSRMKFLSSSYNRQQFFLKTRPELEKQRMGKNSNFIQLKKVQFRGIRIELAPEQTQKQIDKNKQEMRKRKINSRANQQFRKKISFIAQPRTYKQLHGTESSNEKDTNYSSIRINNCKVQN